MHPAAMGLTDNATELPDQRHKGVAGACEAFVDTRAIGVGVESHIPIEMTVYVVLRFRDRKIVWTKSFMDRTEALEAAGLEE